MRMTVEMKPEHHAALLAVAVGRGQEGISVVLEEAIEMYLAVEKNRQERRGRLHSLAGILSDEEADRLRNVTENLRTSWS